MTATSARAGNAAAMATESPVGHGCWTPVWSSAVASPPHLPLASAARGTFAGVRTAAVSPPTLAMTALGSHLYIGPEIVGRGLDAACRRERRLPDHLAA